MSLKHCKSIKPGERKGGIEGPPLVPFVGCPVVTSCPLATKSVSRALQLPESLPLLPGPTAWPGFGAEWAHLSCEAGTASCKGRWRLSWGGSGGAQQRQDGHKQVWGGGSVL